MPVLQNSQMHTSGARPVTTPQQKPFYAERVIANKGAIIYKFKLLWQK